MSPRTMKRRIADMTAVQIAEYHILLIIASLERTSSKQSLRNDLSRL